MRITAHGSALRAGICAALITAAACDRAGGSPPEPPPRLADTGLYADLATRTVAPGVLPFSPQYPLWSDGARKRRWIRLPPGTSIDASDPDCWRFPVGTKLWKEFAFDRAVETRYLEHVAEGVWLRATYAWNAAGSDAVLAPEHGVRGAAVGAGGAPYDIPPRSSCTACHDAGAGPVLGFSALQLSPDRDPHALHAEAPPPGAVDLSELVARGLVRGLPPQLLECAPRIAARSAIERAALGYLHGNCSACHNQDGPLAALDLRLGYPLAAALPGAPPPAAATTFDRPSRFRAFAAHDPCVRVAPGDPSRSVLLARLRSRFPASQMPPLATNAVDLAAVELFEAWIRSGPGLALPFHNQVDSTESL